MIIHGFLLALLSDRAMSAPLASNKTQTPATEHLNLRHHQSPLHLRQSPRDHESLGHHQPLHHHPTSPRFLQQLCNGFSTESSCLGNQASATGCTWDSASGCSAGGCTGCSCFTSVEFCIDRCAWDSTDSTCTECLTGCSCFANEGSCGELGSPGCTWSGQTCDALTTESPTVSSNPSSQPSTSLNPSTSSQPSSQPSESDQPSTSSAPSSQPSESDVPSSQPSSVPSSQPSSSMQPSSVPSSRPSSDPSSLPSLQPSSSPSVSDKPSSSPSITDWPTSMPSEKPSVSDKPSSSPSVTDWPTSMPSEKPSVSDKPSSSPSVTDWPTSMPSEKPSVSDKPSSNPSITDWPTTIPSEKPSVSDKPSSSPSVTEWPTTMPSEKPSVSDKPSSTPTKKTTPCPITMDVTPEPTPAPVTPAPVTPAPTKKLVTPAIISGKIFNDVNQDGDQDTGELGLKDIIIALWCARDGLPAVKVATTTTDANGGYIFNTVQPGQCFIEVDTKGYVYSPIVPGGNQLGPDGRSPVIDVKFKDVINSWCGGLFSPFSEICVKHTDVEPKECGWGLWNACTCQCDCNPGFCLSANQQCYDGCKTHEDFNTWGGCRSGVDCPWYPDKHGEPHCESSANFAGIHNTHETAEICCKEHFGGSNVITCIQASVADVQAEMEKVQMDLARDRYYWPDQHGKGNCVFDSGYDNWMEEDGFKHDYLFDNHVGCCGKWFPARTDCPDLSPATPKQVDYKLDASSQFYYPHLSEGTCRFGRNYPMWMAMSPRHYLYQTPEHCCDDWGHGNNVCPSTEDDGVQEGFYWQVDESFYPNFKGDNCAYGNSYPEWMADVTNEDTHLFRTVKECCDCWFRERSTACQNNYVTVIDGHQVGGPDVTGTWYPSLNGHFACIDGTPPGWMTAVGYAAEYVFDSHSECCKAHTCEPQRQMFD